MKIVEVYLALNVVNYTICPASAGHNLCPDVSILEGKVDVNCAICRLSATGNCAELTTS